MFEFIGTFNVVPSLPEKLAPLREIAYNLRWSWDPDALQLFRRMDSKLWEETNHNPVLLLGKISQERLKEVETDDGFISHMNRVFVQLNAYIHGPTWYKRRYSNEEDSNYIAYFSAEFGLTESLQIYSGGLGVLSGDHLKSASELGLPLVAIGLCYKEGYFQQYLTSDGWQQERYELNDFENHPMKQVLNEDGSIMKVEIDFPGRKVYFQIWEIQVGRIPLYLLDTNIPENNAEDKNITRSLYGGNVETRIQQEILLGMGGIRALHALDKRPLVCHMNEGHSAFMALERMRYLIKYYGLTFEEAKATCYYSNVFTTHTPVPAGIDVFPNELVEKYLGDFYRNELKINDQQFFMLGTILDKKNTEFNMAHLAMNTAGFVNGVSKLHGDVSKKMWVAGFKDIPFDEIPIDSITNGIHIKSHISNEMYDLLYRYLGDKFNENPSSPDTWTRIDEIPDEELWRTHERRRERLVAFARNRLRKQLIARGGSVSDIAFAMETLNASALTIGFARRFATYKRATLIFRDIERLYSILSNSNFPAQIIIAGKAHPQDDAGKKLIQEIVQLSKEENLRKKIVFLENYDMNIARYMVQGCDIWLNNPRRPLEASGTSGMKIIANGGLNLSVLDGWWDEGYDHTLGWKIGSGEEYQDLDYQDEVEFRLIYEALENEIIPLFYNRADDKLPRGWIKMMKQSMKKLAPQFNTNRMVAEYFKKYYHKAYENRKTLMENEWEKGKQFAHWKKKIDVNWKKVKFKSFDAKHQNGDLEIGGKYLIDAVVDLGELTPDDVQVQIYFGKVDERHIAHSNSFVNMDLVEGDAAIKSFKYSGEIDCGITGNFGYTLRILPKHELLINPFELGLIQWAK